MLFHEYLLRRFSPGDIVLRTTSEVYTKKRIQEETEIYVNNLINFGITRGDRIILLVENGFNAICAQLASSVIGSVFIPVSPNEPSVRLRAIIEKYTPKLILINKDISEFELSESIGFLDLRNAHLVECSSQGLCSKESSFSHEEILYIISTSGTTGNPKGIMMSHKATIAFFEAIVKHCNLSTYDVVGSISPLQFDFSLLDLGLAWGSQATLALFSQNLAYTPKKLLREIERSGVTQMNCVPAIWIAILRYCKNELSELKKLSSILYAGDKFPLANMEELWMIFPDLKIVNCFGQSESIACTFYDLYANSCLSNSEIPIGNGYDGSEFYIVDDEGNRIMEENIEGELWLSNDSLFYGYWENSKLNCEKLITDPFNQSNKRKVYKTGDIIKKKGNNHLFIGRKDSQVKVNGNRVELDEIEQVVARMKGISEVVAIGKQHENTVNISLYVSYAGENFVSDDDIRKHCRIHLPIYMVPNEIFISNCPFPITNNGKIDKKKLSELSLIT
ncbi:AMP-binding protein [Sphingobacterium multivorum]|uniref:AMP-binding protein n=1 Tax=Sphingobacterium siyangense TaxID=459529 RepID=UPI00191979FA|nr:AMP-binding protein [Sphingobacterium multivorum]QQT32610.1 AMP-binding protein [Sphingobacterium multivorum]